MAITDLTKRAKIFMIYDLPDVDTAFGALATATIFGPQGENFTFREVRSQLSAALAAATTEQEALIDTLLTQFDNVWDKDVEISEDGGTKGQRVFSTSATMTIIRRRVSSLLGMWVPEGGFFTEHQRISSLGAGPRR